MPANKRTSLPNSILAEVRRDGSCAYAPVKLNR